MIKNETKIGYSLALLDIAKEEKKINDFYKQSNVLLTSLENEPEFEKILDSYKIDQNEKNNIIKSTFKNIHWSLLNTIEILSSKNQFKYFKEILKNLINQLQEIIGIKQGIVYSTKPLTAIEINKLEKKLEKEFKTKVTLKNLIDKELIGGFRINLGSTVIEDSVKSELKFIENSLKSKKGGV